MNREIARIGFFNFIYLDRLIFPVNSEVSSKVSFYVQIFLVPLCFSSFLQILLSDGKVMFNSRKIYVYCRFLMKRVGAGADIRRDLSMFQWAALFTSTILYLLQRL